MFTKTGWVNVCAYIGVGDRNTFHYEKIEREPRIFHTPFMDSCRAAYKNSIAYKKKQEYGIGKFLPREPGSDDT